MTTTWSWNDQILYQIFVRSFRDGDGDGSGDFLGIADSLGYLQDLGVTGLWLNPVFPSDTHHNYFTTDFFATDPDYGSLEEFAALCRAVHARDMRIFIDMETQYVPRTHPWFQDAHNNPGSGWSDCFLWQAAENSEPLHLTLEGLHEGEHHLLELPEYVTLNLHDPQVFEYQKRIFGHWLDPLGNGDRASGVDGFRLDHVMDDLDGKGVLTGLLAGFWRPLLEHLRRLDPSVVLFAEQGDWSDFGAALFARADLDGVFAIPLMFALRGFDPGEIRQAVQATLAATPAGKASLTVLENHDVTRLATALETKAGRERLAATMLLTLPGVPTLYYGQELGMRGATGASLADYHLPVREAFRWHRDVGEPGMAVWYRERDFWQSTNITRSDGRTYEAQDADPDSLLNWYRRLIRLRRSSMALQAGDLIEIATGNEHVIAYARRHPAQTALILLNLSPAAVPVQLDLRPLGRRAQDGSDPSQIRELGPYAVRLLLSRPETSGDSPGA